MVKCLYECALAGIFTTTANVTSYMPALGLPHPQTSTGTAVESNTQYKVKVAGILSNFFVSVQNNGISGSTTVKLRQNGSDSSILVTIGSSSSGEFEDLTHTVNIISGDLLGIKFTPGSTIGTLDFSDTTLIFDNNQSSTLTSTPLGVTTGMGATGMTTDSATYFIPIHGQINITATVTVESQVQTQFNKTGTWKNLAVKITSNSRTTTTTVKSRKNGVNGNQIITIGSTATGLFEDTTNSDSISVNDQIDWTVINGTGTSAITYFGIYSNFENTDYPGATPFVAGANNSANQLSTNTANRSAIFGMSFWGSGSDVGTRVIIRNPFTLSNYSLNVVSNSFGSAVTFTLVKNSVNTTITTSVSANSTGVFTDTTHTVTTISGDNLYYITNFTPFSGTMIIYTYSIFATTNVPLQSYSISESTLISDSQKRKAIPKITTIANSISSSLNKKTVPTGLTNTITISTTILRKIIPKITTQVISTSDSITKVKIMFRTLLESISVSSALKKKVIPIINAASISLSQSIKKVAIKTSMTESSSISNTLKLTVIRRLSESIVSNTTIKKFAVKTIQETAITVSASPSLKNIKKLTESSISISSSILKMYKAMRSISENYSIHSDSIALKIVRKILSSSVSVSSILVNVRIVSRLLSDTISAVTSSTVLKVIRKFSENITVLPSSLLKKIFTNITQSTTISNTLSLKTVKKPSNIISASDLMSQHLNAKRTFIESISHSETFTATHIYKRGISEPSITATDGASVASKRMRFRNIIEVIPIIATVNRKAWFYRSTVDDTIIHFKDKLDSTYINFGIKRLFNFGSRSKRI